MDYINLDYLKIVNWEMIRDGIGLLICLIAVLCLKRRKPTFHQTLNGELTKKKINTIKDDVNLLKKESVRIRQIVNHVLKPTVENITDINDNVTYNHSSQNSTSNVIKYNKKKSSNNKNKINGRKKSQNPYKTIKSLLESGMNEEQISKITDIPTAELDLILKIDRLTRLKKLQKRENAKQVAYR